MSFLAMFRKRRFTASPKPASSGWLKEMERREVYAGSKSSACWVELWRCELKDTLKLKPVENSFSKRVSTSVDGVATALMPATCSVFRGLVAWS